jgi:8-oxo-dGTP pyrophosphatase MutT (NUDIX family)
MPLKPSPLNPWRTVSSTVIYRNPWTRLVEDALEGPNGEPGLFGYFAVKDGALVLPLFPDRTTMLIRQWRYVYGCSSWELPCGSVEQGEASSHAAARELAEEGGLRADQWTPMGSLHASDCRVGGLLHCYLAENLSPLDLPLDATEVDLVRQRVPLDEALAAVHDGIITHIASAYLLLRVERYLCARDRGEVDAFAAP